MCLCLEVSYQGAVACNDKRIGALGVDYYFVFSPVGEGEVFVGFSLHSTGFAKVEGSTASHRATISWVSRNCNAVVLLREMRNVSGRSSHRECECGIIGDEFSILCPLIKLIAKIGCGCQCTLIT